MGVPQSESKKSPATLHKSGYTKGQCRLCVAASFGNDIEKCMVEHAMFLRKLEALVFGRGKSPPERLCAQAFGLARIRRYPLCPPLPRVSLHDIMVMTFTLGLMTACSSPNQEISLSMSSPQQRASAQGVTMSIRPSVLAGQWYPGDASSLTKTIEGYLAEASPVEYSGDIRAIIVPHAGHTWSGPMAAAAYQLLKGRTYRRICVLCPDHRVPIYGAVGVSADGFATPLGVVPVDTEMTHQLRDLGLIRLDDGAHRQEHAIEIQLPFLQVVFGTKVPSIIPIIVGDIASDDTRKLGEFLREDRDALLVISTDFLHYGEAYEYVPFGAPVQEHIAVYDARTVSAISLLNGASFEAFADANPHAACGIHALRVLSYTYENTGLVAQKVAYDTSGRRSGDEDMSVSYVAMVIGSSARTSGMTHNADPGTPLTWPQQRVAHDLVRRALREAVDRQSETPFPRDFDFAGQDEMFRMPYGVFVTLNEPNGQLRGCIGNILPVAPLSESLWGRAQDAALNDPRFDPVQPQELDDLSIEISVLTKPVPVSGPQDIVVGKHGVVLQKGFRKAVFLPQVATEQGWSLEEMLMHLSLKAGLSPNAWRDGASFQTFEAQVF